MMSVLQENKEIGCIVSRCHICKVRTFYSINFNIPVMGRDPEIRFSCANCKAHNALQFASSPKSIVDLNLFVSETDIFLDKDGKRIRKNNLDAEFNNNQKEVENKMVKKDKPAKEEKVVAPKAEKGPSKTDSRKENAKKIVGFLVSIGVADKSEQRKSLSCCYNLLAKNQI